MNGSGTPATSQMKVALLDTFTIVFVGDSSMTAGTEKENEVQILKQWFKSGKFGNYRLATKATKNSRETANVSSNNHRLAS